MLRPPPSLSRHVQLVILRAFTKADLFPESGAKPEEPDRSANRIFDQGQSPPRPGNHGAIA